MMTNMEKRLRVSGILIILGLIVEGLSLIWARPIAFVVFILVGGTLITAGIVVYLLSLVSMAQSETGPRG
jgi:hypothetical protein